jgi:hypothetical protein
MRTPSHRHAAPCGPWPWMNLDDHIHPSSAQAAGEIYKCPHEEGHCVGCWDKYPQSLFPNWTPSQVERSKMKLSIPTKSDKCVIHRVQVTNDGKFHNPGSQSAKDDETFWRILQQSASNFLHSLSFHDTYADNQKRADNVRVRALFIENISVPVLQMLGHRSFMSTMIFLSKLTYQTDMKSSLFSGHLLSTGSHPDIKRISMIRTGIVSRAVPLPKQNNR